MDSVYYSEMLLIIYQTTRRHNQEDSNIEPAPPSKL